MNIPVEILQGIKWCMIIICIGYTVLAVFKGFIKILDSPKIISWFDKLKGARDGG